MKRIIKCHLCLLSAFAATTVSFYSCTKEKDVEPQEQISPEEAQLNEYFKFDASEVQVVEETTFNILDEMQKRIANHSGANSDEDVAMLEYYQAKYDSMKAFFDHTVDSMMAVDPGNSLDAITGQILEMERKVLYYRDIGADGKEKVMSVLIVYPTRLGFDIDARNIILGCHYTVTDNKEIPTMDNTFGLSDACLLAAEWTAWRNYLVVMPDYEGYGASVDYTHPYLNREVQARQTMKALTVAMEWFTGPHGEDFDEDMKIVIEGFSQGGAVAAATYRYWLEHINDSWAKKLPIAGAVCADGPYDPLATLQYYCKRNWLTMPVAPALMLKGMCETDPDAIAANLKVSDFLSADFCNSGIFERINSKECTTTQCEWVLHENPGSMHVKDSTQVSAQEAFRRESYEYFLNGTLPADESVRHKLEVLKHCLQKNSLHYNYNADPVYLKLSFGPLSGSIKVTPKYTFFHGGDDPVVPYDNVKSVYDKWGINSVRVIKCTDVGSHGDYGALFFMRVHDKYVDEILFNKWYPGYDEYNSLFL